MDSILNLDPYSIMSMLVFSGVGYVYFSYGKRQSKLQIMVCGLILMVYTYFVDSLATTIGVGVVLTAAPFILRWW